MSFNVLRLQERRQRYEAEEKAEQEKRTAPYIESFQHNYRALRAKQNEIAKDFWSRPLEKITKESTLEEPLAVDELLEAPTTEHRNQKAERQAFDSFMANLTATSGFTLSVAGSKRLLAYAIVQATTRGVDLSQAASWGACFDRLYSLGCFDETSEIGYDASLRTVAPEPEPEPTPAEPTMADLDSIPSSREGLALQRKIVTDHVFSGEVRGLFQEWLASLYTHFGVTLTKNQQDAAVQIFVQRNWSFLNRKNFDECRRILVARNILPESCLTADDQLCIAIENTPVFDRAAKQELIRRQAMIHQQST